MGKMGLIAWHEFKSNVRRGGFLFGAFGVPIILVVVIGLVTAFSIQSEEDTTRLGQVGYVDLAGVFATQPPPAPFMALADETAARAALDAGEIGAYFVVDADYLTSGSVAVTARASVPDGLYEAFDAALRAALAGDLDPALLERLQEPVALSVSTLNNGRTVSESGILGLFLSPILFVMVFLVGSQSTSAYLMSGIVEEKTNRIMEILVTSVTPFQLLFGKIIGLGALGLVLLTIWVAGAGLALAIGGQSGFLSGVTIPPDLLAIGFVYFLLTYFFISSLMAGVGAIFGSEQESRQIAGLVGLPLAIPFFFIIEFFTNPDGPLVTALTLIPVTAPLSVILRLSFGSVPAWQIVLSMGLMLAVTLFTVWASAKIFRYTLLMYGKRATPRELWRVLRSSGTNMNTTATAEAKG